jgi:deoxyribodipyrimidine photo-lyase
VEFIWHSLAELSERLNAAGGGLHVLRGSARQEIPRLAACLGVAAVYANRDYEPFATARDAAVAEALRADGRALHLFKDQVIFDGDELLTAQGRPYHVFTPYKRAWLGRADGFFLGAYPVERHLDRLAPPATDAPEMPGLRDLGFESTNLRAIPVPTGESGARWLWEDFRGRLGHYHEFRDYPGLKGPSYLSVHLRFGTISVRELARHAHAQASEGARVWLSELIWREFYHMLLARYPHTTGHAFQTRFDALPWPNPPGHFQAWAEARTGYPIIDAAQRQIRQTGYMHNRLRMLSASFLTKDLRVDWRLGERWFADKLIDYDQAANVGGWQWSAGVGTDAQPWFRVFNPVTQSRRFDPEGRFIHRYLPELAAVPDKYLHAPWTMPGPVQAQCGVVIGRDYPPPVVDHAQARLATLALFKAAGAGAVAEGWTNAGG